MWQANKRTKEKHKRKVVFSVGCCQIGESMCAKERSYKIIQWKEGTCPGLCTTQLLADILWTWWTGSTVAFFVNLDHRKIWTAHSMEIKPLKSSPTFRSNRTIRRLQRALYALYKARCSLTKVLLLLRGPPALLQGTTTVAGFRLCMMKEIQPSNRSVRPQYPTRFQRLDFHGVRCSISIKMKNLVGIYSFSTKSQWKTFGKVLTIFCGLQVTL